MIPEDLKVDQKTLVIEYDSLMVLSVYDTEFYLSFKAVRMIVDSASHKKAEIVISLKP